MDINKYLNIKTKNNICPFCNKSLLLIRSQQHKICTECDKKFVWSLKYKQPALIQHQR